MSTTPVPPEKTAVMFVVCPGRMTLSGLKLVMTAGSTTSTSTVSLSMPISVASVSVKVVLAIKTGVSTGTPLVTSPMPLSMVAVPPSKTAVSFAVWPFVILPRSAVKLLSGPVGPSL